MSKRKKAVKKPAKKKVANKAKRLPKKPALKAKPKVMPKVKAAKVKPAPKAQKPIKPPKAEKVAKPVKPLKAAPAPKPEPVAKGKAKENGKAKLPAAPVVEPEVEAAPPEEPEEIVLTDAEGRRYCRVKDCDQLASVDTYCRYHYLLYWKRIQVRKKILTEGKLERYIEELTARYPDKFLDMLRKDLKSEKEFLAAIQELEIDESQGEGEFEDESENYIDEVRGMSEPAATREEEDF
jgi:hypothetical protein